MQSVNFSSNSLQLFLANLVEHKLMFRSHCRPHFFYILLFSSIIQYLLSAESQFLTIFVSKLVYFLCPSRFDCSSHLCCPYSLIYIVLLPNSPLLTAVNSFVSRLSVDIDHLVSCLELLKL